MVRASEPSPAEQAFDFPRWRLYEIEHRYELGLSGKDLLMEYAEDMLTLGEPKSYDAYGTLFSSTNSRLRTESATAFIEACRYRTEKPRGPADEFRKRAMEALSHSDGELPEDVALTVLSTHKSQGNFRELLRFFTTGGKSQPLEALDALLSCFIEIPAEQEQHLEELLPILLDSIKKGSPQIHELIAAKLSALPPTSPLRGSLRKNLKILLADLDVSADTRKHALEMLSHMGESKKPQKLNTSVLQELLDEPDDEEEESPDIQVIEEHFPIPAGLSSARRLPLPKELEAFLKLRDRPDVLKAAVQRLLQHHYEDIIGYYAHLFTAQDPLSGKMLFEHIVIAARTLLEYFQKESRTLRKGESLLEDKARDALFWTFFQKECPDLVKMESFEYLNSLHFLEASKADTLKRYALAFAREALTTRSQSAACRALADLINLRTSGRALDSLEGKSLDELLDSFTSLLFKENDREKRDRALTLLHHISFQNPRTLNPLALRIHPLHYVTAIDILSELVRRYNWSAGALLIEAAGNDYMDIRNKTVSALAVVGPMLWPDQKQRVVGIILEKLDDCYDEEARQIYLETILKIDPQSAARHLVARCLNASIHERREFMELLMHCLERLKAPLFFDWCDQGGHLASLRKILLSPPLDNATKNQAKRFVGLYRENHIRLRGRESWEALQNSPQDERWSIIREISKIM